MTGSLSAIGYGLAAIGGGIGVGVTTTWQVPLILGVGDLVQQLVGLLLPILGG